MDQLDENKEAAKRVLAEKAARDRELNQAKTMVRAIKNKAFEEKYESHFDSSSSW